MNVCGISGKSVLLHDGILMYQFLLDTDVETAARAESLMLDAIAEQSFAPADKVMYFSCAIR